jgi:methylthioribose-1-phosphate isomerase
VNLAQTRTRSRGSRITCFASSADRVAYQVIRDEQLATLPGVHRLSATIVMKRIVDERPLPLH